VTWVTTSAFLDHFDLASLDDLPRVEELAAAGLFDAPVSSQGQEETGDEGRDDGDETAG
jgi:segregation and condensation protein B